MRGFGGGGGPRIRTPPPPPGKVCQRWGVVLMKNKYMRGSGVGFILFLYYFLARFARQY